MALSFLTGVTGSTIPFALLLLVAAAASAAKHLASRSPDARQVAFATLLVCAALGVVIGLDIFRVEGDIDRMNSVFKLYLQVWVLLALASAYLAWRILRTGVVERTMSVPWARAWGWALALLVLAAAVYPVLGTQDRLKTRFDVLPLTLDGMAYMRTAEYNDANGTIDLSADYDAIRWLQANVQGSPVVLEGLTPNYRWGGRISIYTGLPSVVGWRWHQEQQRWGYRRAVGERARDVNRIYATRDPAEALDLMRKYNVEYVYLGRLERLYYPAAGLAKFEQDMAPRPRTGLQHRPSQHLPPPPAGPFALSVVEGQLSASAGAPRTSQTWAGPHPLRCGLRASSWVDKAEVEASVAPTLSRAFN